MGSQQQRWVAGALAAVCWIVAATAIAQTDPPAAASKLEELREQIAALEKRASEWDAKAAEYQRALREAPARRLDLAAEIAAQKKAPEVVVGEQTPLDQIEVQILSAEQDLALAQREVAEQNAERDRRSERRRQLPELLADAKSRLAGLGDPPPPVNGEDAAVSEARRVLHERSRAALASEIRSHEQELLSFEERGQLLDQQILRASLRVTNLEHRVERLRQIANDRRQHIAEREVEDALGSIAEARSLSPDARDVVRRLAQENAELARIRTGDQGLRESIDDVSRKLANVDKRLVEIDADYERLTDKVASGGLTDSVGMLLRRMRSQAPDVGKYRRFIRMRKSEIGAVQTRQEELRDELQRLSNLDGAVAAALERIAPGIAPGDRAQLESLLRDLFETKRKHLSALLGDYDILFQKLVDFDARQQQLIQKTEDLLRFIDARVLWIPSGRTAARWKTASDAAEALAYLAKPQHLQQLGRALLSALLRAPLLCFLAIATFAASFLLVRRLKPRLHALATTARDPTHTEIAGTFEALGITLVSAPWGAAALAFVGWRLASSPDATLFVRCVAQGALAAALFWITLELPRQVLRRDGLAEAHFGWPADAVRTLRREISWVASVVVPLVFVMQLFESHGEDAWRESIGRIAFIAAAVVITLFTHRILREGGALRQILQVFDRFSGAPRWVWTAFHVAGVAAPVALAGAAATGYYWTALQLGSSFHLSLVYLFLLLVVLHLALRWSLLARRRLAFEQWRAEHEKAQVELAERKADGEKDSVKPPIEEPELDLGTIDVHTGRLLSTSAIVAMALGLWFLWADLVPAVGVLDSVELWSHTVTQTVEVTAPDGSRQFHAEDRVVPVTLASLLVALLIGFMTYVVVRNLQGLLEISVFRRLGTGPGERYAVTTLAQYAIIAVGGVMAFNTIGVDWSKLQWLVAAVGLGLGFGLQEIFANFVSGLIILFERPMRVGDSVMIGNLSGTVTRIRIRATWLVGGDRKEIVVPNKQFVTNHLVNASLSDPTIRVEVPIAVARGADTERAMRALLEVAQQNERVLAEPKPNVMFLGFGESALNFELRAYSDVDDGDRVKHELGLAALRALREAEVEIALPQRDLHIRSVPEPPERDDRS